MPSRPLPRHHADREFRSQRLVGLARSPWRHYRGAPGVMAADLASRPDTGLTVQLCGDAHPGNFGQWQLPGAGSVFDIVDVDQTISGPFEWDLQRFTAGLPILAEAVGVKPASARAAVRAGFEGYRQWIGTYAGQPILDTWFERLDIGGLAGLLDVPQAPSLESGAGAGACSAAVAGRRRFADDAPVSTHDLDDSAELLEEIVYDYWAGLPAHLGMLLGRFDLVDAVRLTGADDNGGRLEFRLLFEERATGEPLLLEVRELATSVYEPYLGPSHHESEGHRFVEGASHDRGCPRRVQRPHPHR